MYHERGKNLAAKIALMVLLLVLCVGIAAADNYVGGIPLETVQDGVVSGGVYMDANTTWWPSTAGPQTVVKTFTPIPDFTEIAWARLYVAVYDGHMTSNYQGTATVRFDGNGDGDFTDTGEDLGTETLDVPFTFIKDGGNDNSGFTGHSTGEPYMMLNDHATRVTSDYVMGYDVTPLITSQNPRAQVATSAISGSFDGRIKMITLVVAYDDGDTDTISYWVNEGHDADDFPDKSTYTGVSYFDLSSVSYEKKKATLMVNHLASEDAAYTFYGTELGSSDLILTDLGEYFGYNVWDITSYVGLGEANEVTYDGTGDYYKIPVAILTVQKLETPVASFTGIPASGATPLTVQFTDTSTKTPTSWTWKYAYKPVGGSYGTYTTFSTQQNPSYTFTGVGSYSIRLTATNAAGSSTKTSTGYITVTDPAGIDLTVSDIRPNDDPDTLFAKETNSIAIDIKNEGNTAALATTVSLTSSDGFSSTAEVPAIAGSTTTTISITDTTVRDTAGGPVTYTATVDPEGTVGESDETDNTLTSDEYTVTYNGYKGKRYWEGGSDVITRNSYDLNGGLLYSSGDSTYHSGSVTGSGWSAYTVTWDADDLPTPSGATVEAAWLYVPYTWDNTDEIPDRFHITFNSNTLTPVRHSEDRSNFGTYPNHDYGLLTYDVTSYFNSAGNSASLNKDTITTNLAMYGLTLAVVYKDSTASRKQIFLNDEFDLLGASGSSYGTTPAEATAYVPFSGRTIDTSAVSAATLVTFVPSGNEYEGNLLFNGDTVGTNVWDYGLASGTQVAIDSRDVLPKLTADSNVAGIQSTDAGSTTCMAASHAFLVIDYNNAPVAAFSATPTSGYAPLTVTFTDASTNSPTSWSWDFGDGETSTDKSPTHVYTRSGTFTVKLTATNAYGSSSITKKDFISTTGTPAPVVAFSATPRVGAAPLSVTFTDASTSEGAISAWSWEYHEVTGSGWTQFSTAQNPSSVSFPAGTYDVRLTATNAGGSASLTKTTYIAASAGRLPLTTVTSGTVNGDLYVGAFQPVPWTSQSTTVGIKEYTQTFTIPTFTSIKWARLSTVVYAAGTDDRAGSATITFDGDGNGVYEDTLGLEYLSVPSTGDNSAYTVSDHGNRVYSDYLLWYDVTSLIKGNTVNAKIVTENAGGSTFDGRVKMLTLVVAYEDGGADTVHYWVNQGHDYQSATDSATSTTFATGTLSSGWTSAELTQVHLSSKDGTYTFNGGTVTGADPSGGYNYFWKNVWDVISDLTAGSDSTLTFTRATGNSYKTPLSVLKVAYTTPAPEAAFSGAPTEGTAPLIVVFTDSSTGEISSRQWAYKLHADSDWTSFSLDTSDAYTFENAGIYDVRLKVNGPGGSDEEVKESFVTTSVNAPDAGFTATPTSGDAPLLVQFTDTSAYNPTSWEWDFGDGETSTARNPTHTFASRGTYSVKLTASNDGGDDSDTKTITVKTPAPVAGFDATPKSGAPPLEVAFTDESSGTIDTYAWTFGGTAGTDYEFLDSTSATSPDPKVKYMNPGAYTVTLTVTGPDYSDTETKANYITVNGETIEVAVSGTAIDFGTMSAGTDETGSTSVNVVTTGSSAWTVTAQDSKTENKGFMVSGSTPLAKAFQISKQESSGYNPLTSDIEFMTGSGSQSQYAYVRQAIDPADGPGSYAITIVFTGGFS